ncbi:RNA polymerase II holoenzyme cyclin-like subunit [Termitomyces sp. T112]|nr:RNA polymerase II holoenzyme cyclin-like subunit [Termitomyces sp. T112]
MATDFWSSSHYKRWIVDRATLKQARREDLKYVDDPDHLYFLAIYFGNAISKLGKKLGLRQRAIATASVFFRRFYLKNAYCETDPFMVIAACCYVAAKAEESPVHIKNVVTESRSLFSQDAYNAKYFSSDHTKLAEMEFYLVDDLECDLVVFHPYRTLLTLCKKETPESASLFGSEEGEADEVGTGLGTDEGSRYWGTGEGQLELTENALQTAWFIINDTYRSDLCLLHPPHIIAIAALYLTFVIHSPPGKVPSPVSADISASATHSPTPAPQPRRSSRQHPPLSVETKPEDKSQDPISFFAGLNVSLPLVATVVQEIISLYTLWERYKENGTPDGGKGQGQSPLSGGNSSGVVSPAKRSVVGSRVSTPIEMDEAEGYSEEEYVTPKFMSRLLLRMREARLGEMAHLACGRPVAINKMLERAQAAG